MTFRERLIFSIKLITCYILYYSGILNILKLIVLRNKAIVLMYHRVLTHEIINQSLSHDAIIVEHETFVKHLDFLKHKFHVISLKEFNENLKIKKPFISNSCLITFDDGWKDNYTVAYPELKRYGLPAVIFLPTAYIGSAKQFWQERLTGVLTELCQKIKHDSESKSRLSKILERYDLHAALNLSEEKISTSIVKSIKQKKFSLQQIEKIISELSVINNRQESNNESVFLNWDEVKQMSSNGITFGSHGIDHEILTNIDKGKMSQEISISKEILESKLNDQVSAFSYPNGNYDESTINNVQMSRYDIAFSTTKGFVSVNDNPFTINRVNIHNDVSKNIPMFYARLLGIF